MENLQGLETLKMLYIFSGKHVQTTYRDYKNVKINLVAKR